MRNENIESVLCENLETVDTALILLWKSIARLEIIFDVTIQLGLEVVHPTHTSSKYSRLAPPQDSEEKVKTKNQNLKHGGNGG